MKKINRFYHRFDSTEIGNGARIMAWIFAIINLPAFIFSVFFFYAWPITLPGIILYVHYWRSGLDGLEYTKTKNMWILTIIYNLILFTVGFMITLADGAPLGLFALLLPSLLGSGMAGIALKALEAHRDQKNEIPETLVIEMDGEWEDSSTIPSTIESVAVENWVVA